VWRDIKRMRLSEKELGEYELLPGDLLVNRVNSRELVGKAAVIPAGLERCVFESKNIRVRLRRDVVVPRFVSYRLQAAGTTYFTQNAQQVVGMASISQPQVARFPLPLPPLDEQREIVAEIEKQLTRLDAGVAALRRVQANLKRYRAAVLKAACEGRLVSTEAELAKQGGRSFETGEQDVQRILTERRKPRNGGDSRDPAELDAEALPQLPEGWTWVAADALLCLVTSGSRGWAKYYSDSGALFIRIGNLDHENTRLDLNDVQRVTPPASAEGVRTAVQQNDILISITADVGMVAVVSEDLGEAYINQHVALARPLPMVDANYVGYYLCASEGGWGYLKKSQRGATKVGLGLDDIRSVPIPFPPLAEQRRIVVEIERRLSVLNQIEAVVSVDLQRATRLRQSVLQKPFSGNGASSHA
jgi:type I restriction enzyme S subunit